MRKRKTVRYICEYCSKGFWKPDDCLRHENKCFKNPNSKSCFNCVNFSIEIGEPWFCIKFEKDLCINPSKNYEMKFKNSKCEHFKSQPPPK